MLCESCKQNKIKVIREVPSVGVRTNLALCSDCDNVYDNPLMLKKEA